MWPKSRTGKLVFESTTRADFAGRIHFNEPSFIHYLEMEVVRLQRIFNNISKSARMNLNNTCKLATRLQFNREALQTALNSRRAAEMRARKEDYVNGNSA